MFAIISGLIRLYNLRKKTIEKFKKLGEITVWNKREVHGIIEEYKENLTIVWLTHVVIFLAETFVYLVILNLVINKKLY